MRIHSGFMLSLIVVATFSAVSFADLDKRAYWNFDQDLSSPTWGTSAYTDLWNARNAVVDREGSDSNFAVTSPFSSSTTRFGGGAFRSERGNGENYYMFARVPTVASDNLNFSGTDDFTFSFWSNVDYPDPDSGWQRGYYFGKQENINNINPLYDAKGYGFYRRGGNGQTENIFGVNTGGTNRQDTIVPTAANGGTRWDASTWAYWTITHDGTTGDMTYYVNGVELATDNFTAGDWTSSEPFSLGYRWGQHQRAITWPTGTNGEAFIDDFAVLGDALTGPEVFATFNLAENSELGYAFGEVEQLLSLHRDGTGTVEIGDLVWSYATGLSGNLGEVSFVGSDYQVMLTAGGTGLIGAAPAVPEPSTFVLAAIGLLGMGWFSQKRKSMK